MPFGLTNAPAAFQQFINTVFTDLLDVCIIVYLDDILIYSKDKASHREHIREVLQHLCKHDFTPNPRNVNSIQTQLSTLDIASHPPDLPCPK